jgi:hypothetical protein
MELEGAGGQENRSIVRQFNAAPGNSENSVVE